MELLGADLVHGADDAAQHVVEAMVAARALDGLHVARLGDHADGGAVARGVRADVARLARGVAEADGAEVYLLLDLEDGLRQAAGLLGIGLKQVVRNALGRLGTNARQPAQLVQQPLERTPVVWGGAHPRRAPGC